MKAEIVTVGDVAEALGVPHEMIFIANRACHYRVITCKEKLPVDFLWCEPVMARDWCRTNDCARLGAVEYKEVQKCMDEISERDCSDLDRPLECPFIQNAGLTVIPSTWPPGPIENPFPGLLPD